MLRSYLEAGTAAATARRLGIAHKTVVNHCASLRRKTGARNLAQVVYRLRDRLA